MITPPYLKKNDTVGIVSPAGQIKKESIDNAINTLVRYGYNVVVSPGALSADGYFAGTDQQRAQHFFDMLQDDRVRAIFCARGGYGTARMLEHLDLSIIRKKPKWIIGFSDITAMHLKINNEYNVESIHGVMPSGFRSADEKDVSLNTLINVLEGNKISYHEPTHPLSIHGRAEAVVTGGNLSVILSLRGTRYDIETKNKILLIEEIDEYSYHLDRMMYNLYLGGKLSGLKGLIIGQLTEIKDTKTSFGKNGWEIIKHYAGRYDYPVIMNFPIGHDTINLPIILGRKTIIQVNRLETLVECT